MVHNRELYATLELAMEVSIQTFISVNINRVSGIQQAMIKISWLDLRGFKSSSHQPWNLGKLINGWTKYWFWHLNPWILEISRWSSLNEAIELYVLSKPGHVSISDDDLEQGLTLSRRSNPCIFVNKDFLEHGHTHIHLHLLHGCFYAIAAE